MKKIILIACSAGKKDTHDKAKNMYTSPLFRKSWEYAQKLGYDEIFILSDEYYLLTPEDEIDHYNKSLDKFKSREQKEWAKIVLEDLKSKVGQTLDEHEFIILAGRKYYELLIGKDGIQNYSIPWKGVGGIGCILKFLNEQIAQLCENHK